MMSEAKLPVSKILKERIQSLDAIRGFAILGILFMNIQSFAMVGQAYLNPMAYGNLEGANKWVWIISHVIADQKFMSIFSMLFGASILMITQKEETKNRTSIKIHYKRNFGLLIIGLIHSYLLWYGDILTPYAICAFLLYPLRKLSINKLFIIGLSLFSISSIVYLWIGVSLQNWPVEVINGLKSSWIPDVSIVNAEVSAYLGSFSEQMVRRAKSANMMHTIVFFMFYLWRVSGLMLIGMALFKSGFLSGKLQLNVYKLTFGVGACSGLILVLIGLIKHFEHGFSIEYSMFLGNQFNYWGSLLMAFAYMAGIILIIRSQKLKTIINRFSSVGRMALSNYLFQSIICTFIFYGYGLGYFGQVERKFQLLIVFAIWSIQLLLSPIWLKYFNYGIFEWIWRSFTLGKIQKLIK